MIRIVTEVHADITHTSVIFMNQMSLREAANYLLW